MKMSERIWLVRDNEKTTRDRNEVHVWHWNAECGDYVEIIGKGDELLVLSVVNEKKIILPEGEMMCLHCYQTEKRRYVKTSDLRTRRLLPNVQKD